MLIKQLHVAVDVSVFFSKLFTLFLPKTVRNAVNDDPERMIWVQPPTLVTLLRPWIRRFTMIISAWWLQTTSKFSGKKFEEFNKNIESLETPKQ